MTPMNPASTPSFVRFTPLENGRGKEVAHTFQEALFQSDGFEAGAQVGEIGLKSVANKYGATENEKLVAKSVLAQGTVSDSFASPGSKYALMSEGLNYIAAGGVTNGPVGAVLADLGCRQMDSIRNQACNSASTDDIRDSNLAGWTMLEQISKNADDVNTRQLAGSAMEYIGDKYTKPADKYELQEVLMNDSKNMFKAFDQIKMLAAQGDAHNPKLIAFEQGLMPEGSGGSTTGSGRPGGGWVDYPSAGLGFGVSHDVSERKWDR